MINMKHLIKRLICDKIGLPASYQFLLLKDEVLKNSKNLSDYEIGQGSSLKMAWSSHNHSDMMDDATNFIA